MSTKISRNIYKLFIHCTFVFLCPLTLYHTIPIFNTPGKESFIKHFGKRRTYWYLAFSLSFFHIVFYSSRHKFKFLNHLILSSANALNLAKAKILSFGKKLNKKNVLQWKGSAPTHHSERSLFCSLDFSILKVPIAAN